MRSCLHCTTEGEADHTHSDVNTADMLQAVRAMRYARMVASCHMRERVPRAMCKHFPDRYTWTQSLSPGMPT